MSILKSDKFKQVDNLRKLLKSHLPKHLHTQILSFGIKGNLITLKVKHQVYKSEIEGAFSKIDDFKYKLKIDIAFKKIEVKMSEKDKEEANKYDERASGSFDNKATDSSLRVIFEDIREAIKSE